MFKWYNCTDDKKTLNKNLINTRTDTNTTIYGDCNILNPVLRTAVYNNENMVEITQFNRVYFIENVTFSKGYYYITCSVDVLSSYKNDIKNLNALIVRNENSALSYIPDTAVITNVDKDIRTAILTGGTKLGNVYNSRNFVLTVV